MIFKAFKLFILFTLAIFILWLFGFGMYGIPALGPVISPFHGFFRNVPDGLETKDSILRVEGLKGRVKVYFDQYLIPHVYAQNKEDLFFTQGYLQARDRLFQMDMMTRLTAGRISELIGEKGLATDTFFVGLGLRESAERSLALVMQDKETKTALVSFARGVNERIRQLSSSDLPIEYKLLGAKPEQWSEIRSIHLMLAMSFFLSGQTFDPLFSAWAKKLGVDRVREVFPLVPPQTLPIFKAEKDQAHVPMVDRSKVFLSTFNKYPDWMLGDQGGASNSWVVDGSKSVTGFPILANDTHLGYAYPNTWYEIQLSAPGINVYGASFPAAPGVVIGSNGKIAWGVTNATIDVVDWLEVKIKNEGKVFYQFDNEWLPTHETEEIIKIKNKKPKTQVVRWTHQGVIVDQNDSAALVVRWIAHQPANSLKVFLQLDQAKDFSACKLILRDYDYPAQNFLCADSTHVGGWHRGKAPEREPGQGRFILDGGDQESDWTEYVPWEEMPHAESAPFIATANQYPTDLKTEHYLGGHYDDSFRAERITELLQSKEQLSAQDFIDWQSDTKDLLAQQAMKVLEKDLSALLSKAQISDRATKLVGALLAWDFIARPASKEAAFFSVFWRNLKRVVWEDQLEPQGKRTEYPSSKMLILMLHEDMNHLKNWSYWFDDVSTPEPETRLDIIKVAIAKTEAELEEKLGKDETAWTLSNLKPLIIDHLAKIPGFGSPRFEMGGTAQTINANRAAQESRNARHGAVWRMVVELGPTVKMHTGYPGGPSGNPFDKRYDSFTQEWVDGKLKNAVFAASPKDVKDWKGVMELIPK